jgi:hypothetical protein
MPDDLVFFKAAPLDARLMAYDLGRLKSRIRERHFLREKNSNLEDEPGLAN